LPSRFFAVSNDSFALSSLLISYPHDVDFIIVVT
jgi:hypothetical protein